MPKRVLVPKRVLTTMGWLALFGATASPSHAASAGSLAAAVEYATYAALAGVAAAVALSAWNALLRRRVAAGTAQLTTTLQLLAASNAELDAKRREMSEIITGIDLAKDCITITDAEGRILFTNRASLELAGLPGARLDDIRGKRADEFQGHPDFQRIMLEMGAALPTAKACSTTSAARACPPAAMSWSPPTSPNANGPNGRWRFASVKPAASWRRSA